jgi:DMSO/TMAO reductase YedYZ molybdopterin-dependent catalytic subunit
MQKRSILSFSVLFLFIVFCFALWSWINRDFSADGMPPVFRAALEWNGKIWQSLYHDRLPKNGPAVTKRPRFNGDIGLSGKISENDWHLEIFTDLEDPSARHFDLGMKNIRSLPRVEFNNEFRCIEGWSENISYAGVRFSDFLEYYRIGKRADGHYFPFVSLETPDGEYYVSIDMESMLHPQTVLAYEMNGAPLDDPNGAPLRLIIPVKYGIKNIKRIGKISFSNKRPPDYWAEQGYDWFSGL